MYFYINYYTVSHFVYSKEFLLCSQLLSDWMDCFGLKLGHSKLDEQGEEDYACKGFYKSCYHNYI
jgi:hypothetical protein